MTDEVLAKIVFTLPDDAPSATESLWAKSLGNGLYEIDNTPWYVRGYALGDIVRCEEQDGELPLARELVNASGNLTVRVFVPAGPEREMRKQRITDTLRGYGCMFEGMGVDKGLIAVTIASTSDRGVILQYLNELEVSKKAYWESGNF
jgi:hypothetical protein